MIARTRNNFTAFHPLFSLDNSSPDVPIRPMAAIGAARWMPRDIDSLHSLQRILMIITRYDDHSIFDEHVGRDRFIDFLHTHLGRFGDAKDAIGKCLDFAFGRNGGLGGFVLTAADDERLVGALVMNKTGMQGYIPENILVYVAVDESLRGRGIGRQLVDRALAEADGDVKLHVEYDNPAKRLYERMGFASKYAEMRWTR